MTLNEILSESVYFGMALSLFVYWLGCKIQKRWKHALINPLLFCMVVIIPLLLLLDIEYETYLYGAKYLSYFLTPATICFALPLYRQFQILKKNVAAVIAGISGGCVAHLVTILSFSFFFHLDEGIRASLLPKSVTTAIALGVSEEIGGIQAVTVVGVSVAGMLGAVIGPALFSIFHIKEPVAQGLAMGCASHAIGTSRAVELGEVQAAMSSLAIVVTGLLTVFFLPLVVRYL